MAAKPKKVKVEKAAEPLQAPRLPLIVHPPTLASVIAETETMLAQAFEADAAALPNQIVPNLLQLIAAQKVIEKLLTTANATLLRLDAEHLTLPEGVTFTDTNSRSVSWKAEALVLAEQLAKHEKRLFDAAVITLQIQDKYPQKKSRKPVLTYGETKAGL